MVIAKKRRVVLKQAKKRKLLRFPHFFGETGQKTLFLIKIALKNCD